MFVVDADAERFLDEGADFRNYTYAKYGRVVLEQPGNFAWQVFDRKVAHVLRDEYRIRQVTKVKADTLEELAEKLEGADGAAFDAETGDAVPDPGPLRPVRLNNAVRRALDAAQGSLRLFSPDAGVRAAAAAGER